MKHILLLFLGLTLSYSYAQNDTIQSKRDKTGFYVKVGTNLVDSTGEWGPFNTFSTPKEMAFSNPFELGLEYRFSDLLAVGIDGSINEWKAGRGVIDGYLIPESLVENVRSRLATPYNTFVGDQSYFAVDAKLKLFVDEALNIFEKWDWLDLYIDGGLGYFEITESNFTGNFGIGANAWVSDHFSIYLDGTAKWAFKGNPFPETNHFQYALGAMYHFKSKDTDKDGIKDSKDDCPEEYGPISNNGCPEEEVEETKEEDPNVIDSDGDGVVDAQDKCPEVLGTVSNNGCPEIDTDGDGVPDNLDKCPEVAGNMADGCKNMDLDNDGVLNELDKCPEVAGLPENFGCPDDGKLSDEEMKAINMNLKIVYFNINESRVQVRYLQILNQNAEVIKANPDSKFLIAGHTDNSGPVDFNMKLSKQRAIKVKNYLVKRGVNPSQLTVVGKGFSEPTSSQKTQQGRALNRRVEVKTVE